MNQSPMALRPLPTAVPATGHVPGGGKSLRGWWMFYILLNPLYLLPSGGLQPAHLFIAATFPIILLLGIRRLPRYPDLLMAAGAFLAYVVVVNAFWFTRLASREFVLSACYVAYNMLMLVVVVTVFRQHRRQLARATRLGLLATLLLEVAVLLVVGDEGFGRAMGTFNDPNQMGYWALLTAACHFVLREDRRLRLIDLAVLALAGLVIAFSVSRAAILGFSTLVLLVVLFSRIDLRRAGFVAAVLLAGAVVMQMAEPRLDRSSEGMLAFAQKRFASKDTANDSLAERGYARLWLFPQYLLLGAGDGEYPARFRLENETHSTVGSILFAYGIVGLSLFTLLLFVLVRRADWFRLLLLLPPMIYGIAQQGVRFSMFWLFLALIYAMSRREDPHAGRWHAR